MLSYNTIFSLIIKKIIRTENNIFLHNYDKTDKIHLLIKAIFTTYDNLYFKEGEMVPVNSNKFDFLDKALNAFMIKDMRENEILNYFCKIQKTYHALNRFAFIIKYKKAVTVVNTDMELNEINKNNKNVICIYQEKAKYLFKINDLLKIINISLSNSFHFFAQPLYIKNPYNNIPFNKSTLYNIYYYLIERPDLLVKFNILELFFKFHECHFNLTKFLSNYEYLLREYNIKNHIKNRINDDLYHEIKIMLNIFNKNKPYKKQINISSTFPKKKLVEVFKPYLLLFINSKHLLIPILKKKAAYELYYKLLNFQNFNPCFGRIIVKHVKKIINNQIKIVKINQEYNDNHILFENNNNNNFLCDHLSYTHKHYIINTNSFYNQEDDEEEDSVVEVPDLVNDVSDEEQDEEQDYEEQNEHEEDDTVVTDEEL